MMKKDYIVIEDKNKNIKEVFLMGMKHSKKYNYNYIACIENSRVVIYPLIVINEKIYCNNVTNKKVLNTLYEEFMDNTNKLLDTTILPEIIKTY
ncbi:MAG: hypothetical protein ACI4XR_05125 [Bacilli bacterium]